MITEGFLPDAMRSEKMMISLHFLNLYIFKYKISWLAVSSSFSKWTLLFIKDVLFVVTVFFCFFKIREMITILGKQGWCCLLTGCSTTWPSFISSSNLYEQQSYLCSLLHKISQAQISDQHVINERIHLPFFHPSSFSHALSQTFRSLHIWEWPVPMDGHQWWTEQVAEAESQWQHRASRESHDRDRWLS